MSRLCVLVPAKDEKLVIAETLKSLLMAGLRSQDIYVVDDGSDDQTGEIAKSHHVQVLRNERNIGKARSIKRAVDHFQLTKRYKFIALMDADTRVNAGYFRSVKESFKQDEKVVVVCGQPKSRPYNWLTAYRCLCYSLTNYVYRGGQSKMGVINVAPGCATTYRSSIFSRLEWSSDTIVEDMDVTVQVHYKELGRIVYQQDAVVYTQDPRTVRDYVKQMYRWHTGTWQVVKKYGMFTGLKKIDWEYKLLLGEGLFFTLMYLLLPIWLIIFSSAIYALLIDLAITATLALIVSVAEKRRDVFMASPAFPFLRYMDSAIFIYSFWKTVVRGQKISEWFAVKRYEQSTI